MKDMHRRWKLSTLLFAAILLGSCSDDSSPGDGSLDANTHAASEDTTQSTDTDQACSRAECDDGNPCTEDECKNGICVSTASEGAPCDDEDACTPDDQCQTGGDCLGGDPIVCNDDNPCTDDDCDPSEGCRFQACFKDPPTLR